MSYTSNNLQCGGINVNQFVNNMIGQVQSKVPQKKPEAIREIAHIFVKEYEGLMEEKLSYLKECSCTSGAIVTTIGDGTLGEYTFVIEINPGVHCPVYIISKTTLETNQTLPSLANGKMYMSLSDVFADIMVGIEDITSMEFIKSLDGFGDDVQPKCLEPGYTVSSSGPTSSEVSPECGICLAVDMNGIPAEVTCSNTECPEFFHNYCVSEWLIQSGGRFYNMLNGECPSCEAKISCPIVLPVN